MKSTFTHDLSTVAGRSRAFGERIDELTGNGMSYNAAVEKMRETPADAELLTKMGDFHKLDPKHDTPHRVGALSHLWTPEARRQKFNELIDHLTGPKNKGGHGLSYQEAIEEMKRDPEMRTLIAAMGTEAPTAPAANSGGAAIGLALGLAVNIAAQVIGGSDWLKLSPWCEADYFEREGQVLKKYSQVVTRGHGERIVSAFNALSVAKGANFRGLPIYRGNPDVDPQRWRDESRLGSVIGVEARDDGLYVRAFWNEDGERNRVNGYLVHPSPVWIYDRNLKARTGRIEPIELRSIGMTNMPNFSDAPAWTN